jgi:hypothetical protein
VIAWQDLPQDQIDATVAQTLARKQQLARIPRPQFSPQEKGMIAMWDAVVSWWKSVRERMRKTHAWTRWEPMHRNGTDFFGRHCVYQEQQRRCAVCGFLQIAPVSPRDQAQFAKQCSGEPVAAPAKSVEEVS